MTPDLVNIYIARLIKEIEELTKNRLLLESRLQFTEQMNEAFQARVQELEALAEKTPRKINKGKEVDTSGF